MTLSLLAYFIDIAIYALGNTTWSSEIFWMMGWVILDTLIRPSESMQGGTLGTNPRQQPLSAWQVSRYWVIWIFMVRDKFV
jgi:hypothetical protein